jgi:hypothetical protein
MLIKADVLELAEREEQKIQFTEFAKQAEEARKKVLDYDTYFAIDRARDSTYAMESGQSLDSKGDTTYE